MGVGVVGYASGVTAMHQGTHLLNAGVAVSGY